MRLCVCVLGLMAIACCSCQETPAKPAGQKQERPTERPTAPVATPDPLKVLVRIKTKLGVDSEVTVGSADAGSDADSDVLEALAGRDPYDSSLTLRQGKSRYVFIPWGLVKEASREGNAHTVFLTDSSQLTGRIITIIHSQDDYERTYELATTTSFTVVAARREKKTSQAWTLTVSGVEPASYDGDNPRFAFMYYYNGGYWESVTPTFRLKVDGEAVAGNLTDFQAVTFASKGGQPTVTVQARGGTPVSGRLILQGRNPDDAVPG